MTEEKESMKKRKMLKCRCPVCESSQVKYRKFLDNYRCQPYGHIFKEPKSDEAKE